MRLNELNGALIEMVTADANADTSMLEEDLAAQARLAEIDDDQRKKEQAGEFLQDIFAMAERCKNRLIEWDEKTIRQMVECVKVIDSEKLLVIFRGGMGKEARMI